MNEERPRRAVREAKTKRIEADHEEAVVEKLKPKRGKRGSLAPERAYDDEGIHVETQLDLCDCLDQCCPGLFFISYRLSSLFCVI